MPSANGAFEVLREQVELYLESGDHNSAYWLLKDEFNEGVDYSDEDKDNVQRLKMKVLRQIQKPYANGVVADWKMNPYVLALEAADKISALTDEDRANVEDIEKRLLPFIGHIQYVNGRFIEENAYHHAKHRAALRVALRFKRWTDARLSMRNLLWHATDAEAVEQSARKLYAQALAAFDRSQTLAQGYAEFCEYLADFARRFGEYQTAIELYQLALPLWQSSSWEKRSNVRSTFVFCQTFIQLRLGMTYLSAVQPDRAMAELSEVASALALDVPDACEDLNDYLRTREGYIPDSLEERPRQWKDRGLSVRNAIGFIARADHSAAQSELRKIEAAFVAQHALPSFNLENLHTDGRWHPESR